MYIVTIDGNILHDPMQSKHTIIGGQVMLETNTTHGFRFTIYPTNPMYASIQKLKSVIEVYDDGELIFRGRPLNDATDFLKGCTVQCEGDLAFFNDSIMPPYDYTGSVTGLLDLYINNHNTQVDAGRRFVLGNVTVTDPNDMIVRSNQEHAKTWEELSQKTFGSSLGGYLMVRHEGGVNYIDYLSDSAYISSQTIELTKNMLDYNKSVKAEDIVTVLIPLGARLLDANGNETNERLTIKSVNGGVEYIEHAAGIAKYGRIVGYQVWDDVTVASNLLSKGSSELNFLVTLGLSISIKAVDLNMIDKSITKLRHFEYVRIKSQPHDIDELMLIKKQTINLDAPDQNMIEVGVDVQSFTDKQLASDRVVQKINADYVTNQKLFSVAEPIHTQISEIIQQANLIELNVTEIKENFVGVNVLLNPVGMLGVQNYTFISSPFKSNNVIPVKSGEGRNGNPARSINANGSIVNVDEVNTISGRGFEFWIEGSMIGDKVMIVPESIYFLRLLSKGSGKIKVKLREYNGDVVIKDSSFFNIPVASEWIVCEGSVELNSSTTHIRLIYESSIDVYSNNEWTTVSDVMLTRGFPSGFAFSGADSYQYSKAEIELLSNQISLKVSQSDYTGNVIASLINQTATVILLQAEKIQFEGAVTANNNFRILEDGTIEAIDANLSGKITATSGQIAGFAISGNELLGTDIGLSPSEITIGSSALVNTTATGIIGVRGAGLRIGEGYTNTSTARAIQLYNGSDARNFMTWLSSGTLTVSADVIQPATATSASLRNIGTSDARYNYIYLVNAPNVSSDRRLKEAIQDIRNVKEFVMAIEPKQFIKPNDQLDFGFVAQQVEAVNKELGINNASYHFKAEDEFQSLSYESFIAPLYAVVQEQEKRIIALEGRKDGIRCE